ncbi:MAG: MTH1187 family thiamine-binding protein [Deltaproteobacteria bacterium]|nr:MTH1187 family thiamine-binding protein [Deltaproteobacteria bacterium]
MLVELSVFPLDKGAEGLSAYVADSIRIIEESGLEFEVHALGTLIEGPGDKVFEVIRKCHDSMTRVSTRVITTVKIDDRKGAVGRITGKVRSVEEKLGRRVPKG